MTAVCKFPLSMTGEVVLLQAKDSGEPPRGSLHTHKHIGNSFHCITDSSTRWFVDWNDTTIEQGCTTNLGPVGPRIHKYTGCGYYYKEGYKYYTGVEACVTFYYCSSIDSELGHCSYNADCCDAIVKCVTLY